MIRRVGSPCIYVKMTGSAEKEKRPTGERRKVIWQKMILMSILRKRDKRIVVEDWKRAREKRRGVKLFFISGQTSKSKEEEAKRAS